MPKGRFPRLSQNEDQYTNPNRFCPRTPSLAQTRGMTGGDKVRKGDRLVDSAVDIREYRVKRIGWRGQDRRRSSPDSLQGPWAVEQRHNPRITMDRDEGVAREMRGPFRCVHVDLQ